jgi:hypothetical protein
LSTFNGKSKSHFCTKLFCSCLISSSTSKDLGVSKTKLIQIQKNKKSKKNKNKKSNAAMIKTVEMVEMGNNDDDDDDFQRNPLTNRDSNITKGIELLVETFTGSTLKIRLLNGKETTVSISKAKESGTSRIWKSTCSFDISIPPPFFKLVSLLLSCSFLL